jgi:ribosome-associated protein
VIQITSTISISENELQFDFIRASGPGGQNVNKVSSAVQLRFDIRRSPSLPLAVKERLAALAGRRLTDEGELIIQARRHRTQQANREDAVERLVDLIKQAARPPKSRRPTKPTQASREQRLKDKARRSKLKRLRQDRPDDQE